MLMKWLFAGVALSAFAAPAVAQEYCVGAPANEDGQALAIATCFLETIEVIGLRPDDAATAPVSVSTIVTDDAARGALPNVSDALRGVPGVAVSRSGGPGALTQVRIRGAEANHTLVLFDGIDVSDPVTGETDFGLLTALPNARVDIWRGASSSIHGTDAIGGVIAISTAREETGLSGLIEAGSRDTGQARFAASNESVSGALSAFITGGVDTSGLGGETDGAETYSGLVKAQTDLSGWTLSGLALARRSKADIDTDSDFDGRLENADADTEANQWLIGLGLDGKTGTIDHRFRASLDEVSRENSSAGTLQDDSTGQRALVSWSPAATLSGHELAGLVSFKRETYERADTQFGGFTNASESFEALSLAAQYKRDLGRLGFEASLRHDFNDSRFEDATTGRLGAAYQFRTLEAQLRASVATGIKNPTFTELYGFFPGSFVGNPSLKPEEALSFEIGWDQYALGKRLHYSLTAFAANLDNEIYTAFNPDFTATALNRDGESERKGFEAAARWSPVEAWSLNGQVTSIASENEDGADEVRVPDLTASLSASWQGKKGQRFGLALDYTGEQDDFDFGAFPAARVTLDEYVLVSANAEWPLNERIAITLRGDNLLDADAQDVFGYATPGVGVYVGLRLR